MKIKLEDVFSILTRIINILFVFSLFILLFFLVGSYQDYLDSSLINLIITYKISSLLFLAFSIFYIILNFSLKYKPIRKKIFQSVLIFAGIAFLAVFYFFLETIVVFGQNI